jgi:hypothetical protein
VTDDGHDLELAERWPNLVLDKMLDLRIRGRAVVYLHVIGTVPVKEGGPTPSVAQSLGLCIAQKPRKSPQKWTKDDKEFRQRKAYEASDGSVA